MIQIKLLKDGIKNFYQIGDTAFSGQGTPAVVMSAMHAVRSITKQHSTNR